VTDSDAIAAAIRQGGIIDITTTGKRSGSPRRIEIVFFYFDERIYISGAPGRRAWLANLHADPHLTFHLKRGVKADLPATARIITDEAERRPILERVCAIWNSLDRIEAFVARAPLIEVVLEDAALPGG
jgi:deazaflavin-dependent oxidoreductase (nitroreductase family)